MPTNVCAVEDGFKFIGPGAVIIVLQHGHPARLAEATRANQKGIAFRFQRMEKARLVNIESLFQADGSKICPPVGNARIGEGHGDLQNLHNIHNDLCYGDTLAGRGSARMMGRMWVDLLST